jgi:flagellar secretion chaperone FliS
MTRYATPFGGNAEATYRQIDLAGRTTAASPQALVGLLYEELLRALRVAAIACESGNHPMKSEKVTRATAILFALESGLDFEKGGPLAGTLARLYAGARREVVDAAVGSDPAPFRRVADTLEEVAGAWRQLEAA